MIEDISIVPTDELPKDALIFDSVSIEIPQEMSRKDIIKILGIRLYIKILLVDFIDKFFYPNTYQKES